MSFNTRCLPGLPANSIRPAPQRLREMPHSSEEPLALSGRSQVNSLDASRQNIGAFFTSCVDGSHSPRNEQFVRREDELDSRNTPLPV